MEYRIIGSTGMKVSSLCLGCMTFEKNYAKGMTEDKAFQILDCYVDLGGNFFDMADNYPGVEALFGRWLGTRKDRDQFVIASKVRFPSKNKGPNDVGLSRKHIYQAIDDCLKLTQAEYIDLYQAHCYDPLTPLEETLAVFDELIKAGKIRYAGASNFAGWHIAKAGEIGKRAGCSKIQSYQMQYNLLERDCEFEIIPAIEDQSATLNAWSPLASGWLTGKYKQNELPPKDSRMAKNASTMDEWHSILESDLALQIPHPKEAQKQDDLVKKELEIKNKRRWLIIDTVVDIANHHQCTPSCIALAWLLQQRGICSAVIGVSKLEQLEDNVKALDMTLTKDEEKWLNEVSQPKKVYPHDFLQSYGLWR